MPLKILVVDDQPHIIRLVEQNLRRAGYAVAAVATAAEALERVRAEPPDWLIFAETLPEKPGFEALARLDEATGLAWERSEAFRSPGILAWRRL